MTSNKNDKRTWIIEVWSGNGDDLESFEVTARTAASATRVAISRSGKEPTNDRHLNCQIHAT